MPSWLLSSTRKKALCHLEIPWLQILHAVWEGGMTYCPLSVTATLMEVCELVCRRGWIWLSSKCVVLPCDTSSSLKKFVWLAPHLVSLSNTNAVNIQARPQHRIHNKFSFALNVTGVVYSHQTIFNWML